MAEGFAGTLRPFQQPRQGLLEVVRQFTPNWFTATMGTGILALALNQFPMPVPGLHEIAQALWMMNVAMFVAFSLLYLTRWILFFDGAVRIFSHSVMSMFFGAIPMGLATITNGFVVFGVDVIGPVAIEIANTLWWIDAVMAVLCGVAIPYMMFTRQEHSVEKMTAVWLLPVVAAEVTAVSAGFLIPHLGEAEGFRMLILGYALWAFSVPLALSIMVILVLRLVLHKLPPREMAATGWLGLGPLGTGALGLLVLGRDAPRVFAAVGMPDIGATAEGIGVIGGAILWGYGAWWVLLATLTTARYIRQGMPFNIGWWGFIFPLGVYSTSTLALARATHLQFLTSAGGVLIVFLSLFWLIVMFRTAQGALRGTLFVAPCLMTGSIPNDFESDERLAPKAA